ncbi:MAG: FAD-dependent oxidoreductase, partial [Thiolinea sp.]
STSHAPSFAEDGHPRDRYRLYHEEKARGGVGLTMIGGSTNIAPDSPSVFGQLYAGDDSIIPWFKKLTDGVRSYGAGIMCQITHMGRRTAADDGFWLPVMGPSGKRERAHRSFPKVMENEDINRVIRHFVDAALRCQRGGFDGIELLSHSHLLGQFLSPLINHREDDYGGSLENRLRLTLQVVEAVREAVGPELILGLRITGDELIEGGLSAEECVSSAQALATTGAVDFLNVLAGAPYDDLGLASWVAPMGTPSAPHLTIAGQIRQAVDVPIFHAGAVADITTARHAVADGHVDLIGMTRAQIADPYLVQKLINGEEECIRPCVGLGYCVDRVNQGKAMVCGHNAATGREATQPHIIPKADKPRKVVVIGGGPAGLESARVSAERGHKVILFEATERLGGQLNLAAKSITRRQVAGISDWLIAEVNRLGVEVRYNHYAEAEDVLAEQADVVLVATGGWAAPLEIPGAEYVHSGWDVLSGEVRPNGKVLVYDEVGDQAAAVCAEVLARAGCEVMLMTPDRAVVHDLGPTNSAVVLRELTKLEVDFECLLEPVAVVKNGQSLVVTLRHVLTEETREHEYDAVVAENGVVPMDEIYYELKPHSRNLGQLDQSALIAGKSPFVVTNPEGIFVLARLGDAVAGRNIHAAVYDALRVCKGL